MKSTLPIVPIAFATVLLALSPPNAQFYHTQKIVPAQLATGRTTADFISTRFGLDAPKISTVNATSYDWWYFDAQSPDLQSTVTFAFHTSFVDGFFLSTSDPQFVTTIYTNFRFPNGTSRDIPIVANGATITAVGNGASGVYNGTGVSWEGASDMSKYRLVFDSPEYGLKGTFELHSTVPAHYPCGPVREGQSMEVAPRIGSANAVPDAVGKVDINVLGTEFKFTGVGYHDKNWSNEPFINHVQSWYWGHGRVGPYSIVWFDTIGADGNEYLSSYAVKNGKVISSTCATAAIKVRPIGSPYPPKLSDSERPKGFTIVMDLGHNDILRFNVTTVTDLVDSPPYRRWACRLTASLNGGPVTENGTAVYEEFTLV